MKRFEEILEEINCINRDTFKELKLIDTSSFTDEDLKYNVYVYQYEYRYISVKTRDAEEGDKDCASVVMEAFVTLNEEHYEAEYNEDVAMVEEKFYRIVKDTTVMTSKTTVGGGYSSGPMKVQAGAIFRGTTPISQVQIYDGMPVRETTHKVVIEGIKLFTTDNDYYVNADVKSFDDNIFSEITKTEFDEASKVFSDRERYQPKPGAFVNFLAR